MKFIDTHAHFLSEYYNKEQIKNAYQEALNENVGHIVNVGISHKDALEIIAVANEYDNIYAALGYHPHEAKEFVDDFITFYEEQIKENNKVKAIGEIGLDYYYEHSDKEVQITVFKKMIELAKKVDLPIILHVRDSFDDAFNVLNESAYPWNKMVFHCFTGSKEMADYILDKGAYISLTGVITFKNFTSEAISEFPLEKIMLETDCPYLSPIPYRGKTNFPKFIPLIAQKLAEIKNVSVNQIAEVTTANAKHFFNI